MDSEKKQRVKKKELIGDNLDAENILLEHTVKKDNKNVTVVKPTACAYVVDLKEKIMSQVEGILE